MVGTWLMGMWFRKAIWRGFTVFNNSKTITSDKGYTLINALKWFTVHSCERAVVLTLKINLEVTALTDFLFTLGRCLHGSRGGESKPLFCHRQLRRFVTSHRLPPPRLNHPSVTFQISPQLNFSFTSQLHPAVQILPSLGCSFTACMAAWVLHRT